MLKSHLKEYRAKFNMNQSELAKRVGVTRQTIGFIEKGTISPSITLVLKICRVFQCKVEDLLNWRILKMNEQQFKRIYPLFNLVCIVCIGLLIIPLSMVMRYTINEGDVLFSVHINPYKYGDMFLYFIIATVIINMILMAVSTIFLVWAKKKFRKINLVPEINDHDEGMSFVTYESMKRSYTWLSVLLPLFTAVIF